MSHFSTPWKLKKTIGFLKFSGDIEIEHWFEMGKEKRSFYILLFEFFFFILKGPATCVKFSRNGEFFASGSSDEQVGVICTEWKQDEHYEQECIVSFSIVSVFVNKAFILA